MDFFRLLPAFTVALIILQTSAQAACDEEPIDVNTASLSELSSLPYIGTSRAGSIISFRPICSLLELTDASSPKKIIGLTEARLNTRWNWYADQSCADTCCLADSLCSGSQTTSTTAAPQSFAWVVDSQWTLCSVECGGGVQERSVSCAGGNDGTVSNAYCLNVNGTQPLNKRVCNTQNCPNYQREATEWSECGASDDGSQCLRTRSVSCYDVELGERVRCTDCCDPDQVLPSSLVCDDSDCFGDSDDAANITTIDDVHIKIDLQRKLNQQRCHTDMFDERTQFSYNNTFIIRRSCAVTAFIAVSGVAEGLAVNASWFALQAELQAAENEDVGDEWNAYLSWLAIDAHSGYLTLRMPSNAAVGEFLCHLTYQHGGSADQRKDVLAQIRLFVLFNPYSSETDEHMESRSDRKEYVENEQGLLWRGSYNNYGAMVWQYDQFYFPNLEIAMYAIRRLAYEYRRDLVLVSRQISFGVGLDICHGRWSEPYTTGSPDGGYRCESEETDKVCREPWYWTGTTEMFDLYRDVLDYADSVQYCQCWVFAAVTTTVGRALGIATRPVTNFQSAHDTDYNRAIDNYFEKVEKAWGGASYYETDGASHDSVWNFHVWNDMFFKRRYAWDADDETSGEPDWNAVDGTPQEVSYGGNPFLADYGHGYYQMGPAQLSMVKNNNNTNACTQSLAVVWERCGCFDQEFVISEVNAQFNAWVRPSTAPSSEPFVFLSSWETDPTNEDLTIGQSMSTKKPGEISANCLDPWINDCKIERLDVTELYKYTEPSGPGTPTDRSNYDITERQRRRLLDEDENGVEYSVYTEPTPYYHARTIVAADPASILTIYHEDDTYALVSLEIDSFFDDAIEVLCTFTATAHAYNGDKLALYDADDNSSTSVIKRDEREMELLGGDSGSCLFNLTYAEYEAFTVLNPYAFKLNVIASVYEWDNTSNTTEAYNYKVIVEQLDFLVCIPKYRFADRIVCESGLKWYEPSYNLSYACDAGTAGHHLDLDSVADGFCDAHNNVAPCFDGGDCCASSCVYGDAHSCSASAFNCIDDRATSQYTQNEDCVDPISFVQYMEQLWIGQICVDVETSIDAREFACTDQILVVNGTGNECVDRIASVDAKFGTLHNCTEDTVYALSQETRNVIKVVADCLSSENRSSSLPPVDVTSTTTTTMATTDNIVIVTATETPTSQQTGVTAVRPVDTGETAKADSGMKTVIWIVVGVLAAVLLVAIAVVIVVRVRKQKAIEQGANGGFGTYLAMTNQPEDPDNQA